MPILQSVHPVLPVRDVERAVHYYTSELSFRLLFRDKDHSPRYAGVGREGVQLHLQWHDAADFDKVERLGLRFLVDDVDALFGEYQSQNVFHSRTTLSDTAWGTREFAFWDLDGNGLFFYRNL